MRHRWWTATLAAVAMAAAACGSSPRAEPPAVAGPVRSTTTTAAATTVAAATTTLARPTAATLPAPTGPPPTIPPVTAPSLERAPGQPSAHGSLQTGAAPDGAAPATLQRTPMGCAAGTDAASLDRFFAGQAGGLLGFDYPHAQPLPDGRVVWLAQDAFVRHGVDSPLLTDARLVRNAVAVQEGRCFTLVHGGTLERPEAFESGVGEVYGVRWWWPLGSEVRGDLLDVVWVEMVGDVLFARDDIGLPWFPASTWLGTYRLADLSRVSFARAPDDRVDPIYGYAVASDAKHTYLFGNSYQQDLLREGGLFTPHTADTMYVARVPRGRLDQRPTYWDGKGWSADRDRAAPISKRFGFENPMQPRLLDGRWVAVTKADGFFGDEVVVDIAPAPEGPWQEVARLAAPRRRNDRRLTTYHAYALPWRAANGGLVVSLSQNAGDARWAPAPEPWMYRPAFVEVAWPPRTPPTTVAPVTVPPSTEPPSTEPPATTNPPPTEPPATDVATTVPPVTAEVTTTTPATEPATG